MNRLSSQLLENYRENSVFYVKISVICLARFT